LPDGEVEKGKGSPCRGGISDLKTQGKVLVGADQGGEESGEKVISQLSLMKRRIKGVLKNRLMPETMTEHTGGSWAFGGKKGKAKREKGQKGRGRGNPENFTSLLVEEQHFGVPSRWGER